MKLHYILPLLFITACSLAPETKLPKDRVPEGWAHAAETASTAAPARWSDFGSAELDTLIATALKNNTDLAAALARVSQARASARIAGGGQYPQVDASGTVGTERVHSNSVDRNSERSNATLSVAYELDLWARNRNAAESADFLTTASEQDRAALTLLVSSEVARLYTGVLAFDARMDVAEKNLTNAKDVLRITNARYKEGAISGLELAQENTEISNTEASVASLKNQRDLFFDQLAQVVGVAPANLKLDTENSLAALKLADVPLTTPWQLLERRPDIAAAEARLRAANIDIGIARADALPSLSLSLDAGVAGHPSSTLLGLAASFFAPIFEGGALQGNIERSQAARNEQVAAYQGVLLTAFREVDDALSNYETAEKRVVSLTAAADAARKADTISRARFDAGSIDFTTLIDTQDALLNAEDAKLSARQAQFAARIDLMRALGGAV